EGESPHEGDDARVDAGRMEVHGRRSQRNGTKRIRRARRGFVHGTARLSASALAGFLVRPIGSASTYSRAALGAVGNLGGWQGPCKGRKSKTFAFCEF